MSRSRPLAVVCVLLLAPACGVAGSGPASPSTSTPSGIATGPSAPVGTATPSASSSPLAAGSKRTTSVRRVSYLPWGPADPPIPGQYAALAAAPGRRPDCRGALREGPGGAYWATVAAVCRAVTAGGPWPAARALPAAPPAATPYQACLDRELRATMARFIRWHRAHPQRRPVVSYPAARTISPCQFRIYRVATGPDADPVTQYGEDAYPVVLTATVVDEDLAVSLDGAAADATSAPAPGPGLTTIVVTTSLTERARTAVVALHGRHGTVSARVQLPARTGGEPQDAPGAS